MKMQWKIGNVEIPNPFVLAPMAGVTDLAFRRLCKEQGAGLICMEMVSAKAISFHNKNTGADGNRSRGASGIHAAFRQRAGPYGRGGKKH